MRRRQIRVVQVGTRGWHVEVRPGSIRTGVGASIGASAGTNRKDRAVAIPRGYRDGA